VDGSVGECSVHQPVFHGITDSSICILFVKYRLVYFARTRMLAELSVSAAMLNRHLTPVCLF
jgi:hypothetical protein